MTTLPLSEVKARVSEIADEVSRTHERVQVTRNGRDFVVLLSAQDLESMEATLELLADPAALARIGAAEAAAEAGEGTAADELADQTRRRHAAAGSLRRNVEGPTRRVPGALPHRRPAARDPGPRRRPSP